MNVGHRNVIVVAHCDDECLWAGGLPIRFSDREWTVISCSVPRHDSIRAWKFFDCCKILGVTPRLIPSTESEPGSELRNLEVLDLSSYDCIVTHNEWGEYGHLHHQNVHRYILKHWSHKRILTFGYRKGGQGKLRIQLGKEEQDLKLKALKAYDHLWPYDTGVIPKWEALLHRYMQVEGIPFDVETYDAQS